MRRSDINSHIAEAMELLHAHQIRLPPFAYFAASDWKERGPEFDEIRTCKLGWDVTDFGSDDFLATGLVVFTARNGHPDAPGPAAKAYAEKILIVRENQHTPMHCHLRKSEDIICRAGGNLLCRVYGSTPQGALDDGPVTISLDGERHKVEAGHIFRLEPGASITLTPHIFHEFWAEAGTGTCIAGEVSSVNDDDTDNAFLHRLPRFPQIVEDQPATHKLCTEY